MLKETDWRVWESAWTFSLVNFKWWDCKECKNTPSFFIYKSYRISSIELSFWKNRENKNNIW